jgi:hypothetical protein
METEQKCDQKICKKEFFPLMSGLFIWHKQRFNGSKKLLSKSFPIKLLTDKLTQGSQMFHVTVPNVTGGLTLISPC